MKLVEAELARVRQEIARLKVEEGTYLNLLAKMSGTTQAPEEGKRKRAPNVKPVLLDVMHAVGTKGATTAEADEAVRQRIPTVADGTVGSTLSRLTRDKALVFDGERYYERQYAPIPGDGGLASIRIVK